MIDYILTGILGVTFVFLFWKAYQRQDFEVRERYAQSILNSGKPLTRFICRFCSWRFRDKPAAETECPNCRGLARIRLPRE